MDIIRAQFVRTSDVSVDYLLGRTGVYVLWTPRANRRPSYIGEGNVLKRIVDHVDRFGENLTGVVAVLDGTERERKRDSELLEATLLDVAEDIDLSPPHNVAGGKMRRLYEKVIEGHSVIRVRVSGHHPLRWDTPLKGEHVIEWRFTSRPEPTVDLKHPWRRS